MRWTMSCRSVWNEASHSKNVGTLAGYALQDVLGIVANSTSKPKKYQLHLN